MIVHAITVDHWRNIEHLELFDLDHPIVILHGPNRTGKSSLVAAVRSCLFEDHDSVKAVLKEAVPWQSKLAPELAVEFETAGNRYRLKKRFSKNKDGDATLERGRAGGDWEMLFRGKEAGREVRSILGLEKSEDGLNQLLWMDQGEMLLPEEKKLNLPLQKRFQEVLGSLLTGRDWDFFERLKKACEIYFTDKMTPKKNSPLSDLENKRQAATEKMQELRRKRDQSERQQAEFGTSEEEVQELQAFVAESRREATLLETEQEASRQRRREHELAGRRDAVRKELDAALHKADEFKTARQRLSESAMALDKAQGVFDARDGDHRRLLAASETAGQVLCGARTALDLHETRRVELEDRQRLINLSDDLAAVVQKLEKYAACSARLSGLNTELAQLSAPGKKELDALRKNRNKAQSLKADLAAGALRLTIRPSTGGTAEIAIDAEAATAFDLAPGTDPSLQFRQKAAVSIPQFGTIEIKRGQEDRNLDETARQLAELERTFGDSVRGYGLDPDADDVLDRLDERRARHAELTADVKRTSDEVQELVPDGHGTLEASQTKLQGERQSILDRHAALAAWIADKAEYESLRGEFDRQLKRLKTAHSQAERDATEARRLADESGQRLQDARNLLTQEKTKQAAAEGELKRLGDEYALREACDRAQAALDDAERRVRESELTHEEQTIDQRLAEARNAVEHREGRLLAQQRHSDQLRGELRSMQGLHEELAAAEAELEQFERETAEKRLDAEGHRLLKELFETSRDEQVTRTTGAIGNRVLHWAGILGLHEYQQVEFDAGYLPTGIRRGDVGDPVALSAESLGTQEQLALLVRLAVGGMLAKGERQTAILDDPLTHTDRIKHRRMQEILQLAAAGSPGAQPGSPASGQLQIIILTCHPERFDHLRGAVQFDLEKLVRA